MFNKISNKETNMNNKIGVFSNNEKFCRKIFEIEDNNNSAQSTKNVINNHQTQKESKDDYTAGINKNTETNYTKKE